MKNENGISPPNGRRFYKEEWLAVAIIIPAHFLLLYLSTSEVDAIHSKVMGLANFLGNLIPGSKSYEMLDRRYEIPYIQIFCALFITTPTAFIATNRAAIYDYEKSKKSDDNLYFLVLIIAIFLLGLLILLLPPAGYGLKSFGTHFGLLTPLRYAIAGGILGYSSRVIFNVIFRGAKNG